MQCCLSHQRRLVEYGIDQRCPLCDAMAEIERLRFQVRALEGLVAMSEEIAARIQERRERPPRQVA